MEKKRWEKRTTSRDKESEKEKDNFVTYVFVTSPRSTNFKACEFFLLTNLSATLNHDAILRVNPIKRAL